MSFSSQLKQVKSAAEDFEWYPTTNEIIAALKNDIEKESQERYRNFDSFLDIGAGNGKVIDAVKELDIFKTYYAIEKSLTLLQSHADYIYTLGVDFHKTTLIDKEIHCVFCNPPYKEYAEWTARIIRELSRSVIYLVIPERWKDNSLIGAAIDERGAKYEVLGSFDFLNAEDREARAKVNLVKINVNCLNNTDPFVQFFDENFKYPEPKGEENEEVKALNYKLERKENIVETLCALYSRRLMELQENYSSVCKMDYNFLQEFNISKASLIESLQMKIASLKKSFWTKLFREMGEITKRLTVESRKNMLEKLNDQTGIEFNRENVYAVVIWAIKNANKYFDEQFLKVYDKMISHANVENYKSNKKVFEKNHFRYENSHYKLKVGHRIVIESDWMGYRKTWTGELELTDSAADFMSDLVTIANNLGFVTEEFNINKKQNPDEKFFAFFEKEKILFEARCFQNGNMHLRFNPDFVHLMNIEHGRLRGWIHSKEAAIREVGAPENLVQKAFETNKYIPLTSSGILLNY